MPISLQQPLSNEKEIFSNSCYDALLLERTEQIIATYFVNGMRKNAIIAKKKFCNAYFELTGEELGENIDIDNVAMTVGYEFSDKIYAISLGSQQRIKSLVNDAISSGNRVIFYDEIYKQNLDFMVASGIYAVELLKAILKRIMPNFSYRRTSFAPSCKDNLECDIVACYHNETVLTYDEIKNRLPYADKYQICSVCSRSRSFVWVREETYALVGKLILVDADIAASKAIISTDIKKHGFAIFHRITVANSIDLNPTISEIALKEAIYILHLASDYERNRSIITLHGASFRAPAVMLEYCKQLSEVTLDELYSYEEELTDKTTYSLYAACEKMIRVDKEHFVSAERICFDVQAIDNAISLYVQNNVVPLTSIKSFTSFPSVEGYAWNSYLLDSYCKHASMQFCSMGGPAKKPVGAIFPIYMTFECYSDLLAYVVANSNLQLNPDNICKFFIDNSYTLRKIDTHSIIAKAQELRTQGDLVDVRLHI